MESEFFRGRIVKVSVRHLPHWTTEEGTYFVTFRLKDSLPLELARRIERRNSFHRLADRFLDKGIGSCILIRSDTATAVTTALEYFDRDRYKLHAYAVMPNHVHVAFRTSKGVQLPKVLHSWKRFTAGEINKLIGSTGSIWQDESYDTLVHDQNELDRVIAYIANNPAKAKLKEWPWVQILDTKFRFSETET